MQPAKLIPAVAKTLTKTMMPYPIGKGNPDCFAELTALARLFGVDFESIPNGVKRELPLRFTDGTESVIRFYRVNGKGGRKDKRYSIPAADLRAQASVGDTIAFSFVIDNMGRSVLCVNVTRQPELSSLASDDLDVTALEVQS